MKRIAIGFAMCSVGMSLIIVAILIPRIVILRQPFTVSEWLLAAGIVIAVGIVGGIIGFFVKIRYVEDKFGLK